MLNYTGIFFENGTHMTWNFGTPLEYPKGVKAGDKSTVVVHGIYADNDVECFIVSYETFMYQPKGTLLHITTKVQNGAKPVMSGQRATATPSKIQYFEEPFYLTGEWK